MAPARRLNDTSVQAIRCNHQNIVQASSAIEAPGSNLSPRGSGCYWLLGLAVGDGVAPLAGGIELT